MKETNENIVEKVPCFTEKQIEKQLIKQINFLKLIYPELSNNTYNRGCIELRPIKRDKEAKFLKSFNTWRLEQKDIKALTDFLKRLNGQGYCLYYSLFAFNYEKETDKVKGKINNQNALYTSVLAMDYDNISKEEFEVEKKKLTNLGIETLDIFTGHGFQCLILLKEKIYDKNIVKKFTELLMQKGFAIDNAIVDCARVFRMPYSFNCKSLDIKNKHYGEGIKPTTVISFTKERYALKDVLIRINTLENVNDNELSFNLDEIEKEELILEEKNDIEKVKEVGNIKIENINSLYYDLIDLDRLPEAIKKMFIGSRSGFRNSVLLFLIPFLRNSLGLNKETIKKIMSIWGHLCSPILNKEFIEDEVERIFKYGFKGKYGKYTEELRKEYGYLEFNKFTKDNQILIPNDIFEDFNVISDGAVKIYVALKVYEKIGKVKESTKKDIQTIVNITERTLERNIKDLVSMGYICKRRANRRQKEQDIYYINPYFNVVEGFTMLDNAMIRLMLKELTNGEIKLYIFLNYMIGSTKKDCWASQKYLAKKTGKTQQGVSLITNKLCSKRYITKKIVEKDNIRHCIYNLNY